MYLTMLKGSLWKIPDLVVEGKRDMKEINGGGTGFLASHLQDKEARNKADFREIQIQISCENCR